MKYIVEIPQEWENNINDYFETIIDEMEQDLAFHPFRGHSRVDFLKMLKRNFEKGVILEKQGE